MSDEMYDETELRKAILPLIEFTAQEDFSVVEEVEGTDIAMAYAVGLNCIEVLADNHQDDWLIELIRRAQEELTPAGLARLVEQGV